MHKALVLGFALSLSLFSCNTAEVNVQKQVTPDELKLVAGDSVEMSLLVAGNNRFALDVFKQLSNDENIFISPFSISSAFAMTYAGASGKTEEEMSKTLHWPANTLSFHKTFSALNNNLQKAKKKEFTFSIANRIYTQLDVELYDQFVEINKNNYGASAQCLDFSKPEDAAKTINNWVSDKTKKMIPELLQPSVLEGAKTVLVNAVYFYGGWALPFEENITAKESFYLKNDSVLETDFMKKYWSKDEMEYSYSYTQNSKFQVLELPYHEENGSMVIFLPVKDSSGAFANLPELLSDLSFEEIDSLLNNLKPISSRLDLKIPKWKQKTNVDLALLMNNMGMIAAFSPSAEFPRISPSVSMFLSAVIHEAVVEVSEKGTKAAASTAIIAKETSAYINPDENVIFHANHPFFYLIKDNNSGSILFIGQMLKP
jgi:serpin B